MKRTHSQPVLGRSAAFTLIEMIGVLAIMSILASVLVPNVLRSMDRAAVRAEAETLKALGEQVRQYAKINGVPPALGTWSTDLGTLAGIVQDIVDRFTQDIVDSFLGHLCLGKPLGQSSSDGCWCVHGYGPKRVGPI